MFLKRKPSKAGRGLSPAQHQRTEMKPCECCSSHPSLLDQDSPVHQTPELSSCSSARGSVLDLLGAEDEQLAVWEPSFIPSPPEEPGSSPPNAAALTHSPRLSHPPTDPQGINTDIPLGNNVFSRSSSPGCAAVHKPQSAECFSCIAKEHFPVLQWDAAFGCKQLGALSGWIL